MGTLRIKRVEAVVDFTCSLFYYTHALKFHSTPTIWKKFIWNLLRDDESFLEEISELPEISEFLRRSTTEERVKLTDAIRDIRIRADSGQTLHRLINRDSKRDP